MVLQVLTSTCGELEGEQLADLVHVDACRIREVYLGYIGKDKKWNGKGWLGFWRYLRIKNRFLIAWFCALSGGGVCFRYLAAAGAVPGGQRPGGLHGGGVHSEAQHEHHVSLRQLCLMPATGQLGRHPQRPRQAPVLCQVPPGRQPVLHVVSAHTCLRIACHTIPSPNIL